MLMFKSLQGLGGPWGNMDRSDAASYCHANWPTANSTQISSCVTIIVDGEASPHDYMASLGLLQAGSSTSSSSGFLPGVFASGGLLPTNTLFLPSGPSTPQAVTPPAQWYAGPMGLVLLAGAALLAYKLLSN